MHTNPTGLRRLYRDLLIDAAQKVLPPCKHILVPGECHCAKCGERLVFGRV